MFQLDGLEIVKVFLVLFSIIDVTGGVPIFLNIRSQNKIINPEKAAFYSFLIMTIFLFVGEWILKLFQLEVSAFAIAGAVVLLILSIEMIFGVELFKTEASSANVSSTLFPIVFPLIAGPASFTTLLAMRADFHVINILIAVALNLIIVYLVLKHLDFVQRILGESGSYIFRKFFGVILMAIAVKMITSNFSELITIVQQ